MSKCIFCPKEADTEHHVLPTTVRKYMGWVGKRASNGVGYMKVPVCMDCHRKLSLLQEPLIKLIKYLKCSPPIPMEFYYILDGITRSLNGEVEQELVEKAIAES